jgi:hypothetical protein
MVGRLFEKLERGHLIAAGPAGLRLTRRGERVVQFFSGLHAMFRRPNQWVLGMTGEKEDAS